MTRFGPPPGTPTCRSVGVRKGRTLSLTSVPTSLSTVINVHDTISFESVPVSGRDTVRRYWAYLYPQIPSLPLSLSLYLSLFHSVPLSLFVCLFLSSVPNPVSVSTSHPVGLTLVRSFPSVDPRHTREDLPGTTSCLRR